MLFSIPFEGVPPLRGPTIAWLGYWRRAPRSGCAILSRLSIWQREPLNWRPKMRRTGTRSERQATGRATGTRRLHAWKVQKKSLQQADRLEALALQIDPVEIVEPVIPQRGNVVLEAPVRKLAAIEQHHRRRERVGKRVIARPRPAPDRLALKIAREELRDIADREHVGVRDQGQALMTHLVWNRVAQRREGLQVVRIPLPDVIKRLIE